MCGIAGLWQASADGNVASAVQTMTDRIIHRGPDASGIWAEGSVGLGHRRLAILDLSEMGAQPMLCQAGRYILTYNGEVYNHHALRVALQEVGAAPEWRGTTDTETLLAGISHWGLFGTLERAFGMFALALWDRECGKIHLARDRMGEKPLYWSQNENTGLVFGSEPVVFNLGGFDPAPTTLAAFVEKGYVPDDRGFVDGLKKVVPGEVLTFTSPAAMPYSRSYWKLADHIKPANRDEDATTLDALHDLLCNVVREQMVSDVPLGSFLSGGIDSSLITALMQTQATERVASFSIGFTEKAYNEAPHAAAIAEHLGTDHTEFILTEDDALDAVPELVQVYAEPFADSSALPTLLLSRLARRKVTVALTGDGGDEVFGGYNRYIFGPRLWRYISRVPVFLRPFVGSTVRGAASSGMAGLLLPRLGLPSTMANKLEWLGEVVCEAGTFPDFYAALTRNFEDPRPWLAPRLQKGLPSHFKTPDFTILSSANWMRAMDSITYLPGDILVKVDRAAMSTGLETRAPFLDGRVVEAAWALPAELQIADNKGKQALRCILDDYVPRALIERPKQGFAIPVDRWLREGLREWAGDLLARDRLAEHGLLNPDLVSALWADHQQGKVNHGTRLWTLLMLTAWQERMSENRDVSR